MSIAYWPFGATRSGTVGTDKQYTGQQKELVSTLGAYYYKARFYSTTTGAFLSSDTVPGGGLNRYAYAVGNPVRESDPSGRCPECAPAEPEVYACASDPVACLTWSYAPYGVNDMGLILLGGMDGDVTAFEHVVKGFLARGANTCGAGSGCYEAVVALLGVKGGADAAYQIFGVRFIETTANDIRSPSNGTAAKELHTALSDQTKNLRGVVGYSAGADVVLEYFANPDNVDVNIAFWAIEPFIAGLANEFTPFPVDYGEDSRQYAGHHELRIRCCKLELNPLYHSSHDNASSAGRILNAVWSLTLDLASGAR